MPDSWEYPWFAAWDLGFHAVTLAHLDPAFAKYQLLLLCREWFQHPSGALPAYEWAFDDVNPPVHAWAALHVFQIDGARDVDFLERIFHKLLINYTWWLNREDAYGNDLFGGGFLGLDNIGAFDRSHVPEGGRLEQSDATAWMAFYTLSMLRIVYVLAVNDPTYNDLLVDVPRARRADHPGHGPAAACGTTRPGSSSTRCACRTGRRGRCRIHSMVGLIPLLPAAFVPERAVAAEPARSRSTSRDSSRGRA